MDSHNKVTEETQINREFEIVLVKKELDITDEYQEESDSLPNASVTDMPVDSPMKTEPIDCNENDGECELPDKADSAVDSERSCKGTRTGLKRGRKEDWNEERRLAQPKISRYCAEKKDIPKDPGNYNNVEMDIHNKVTEETETEREFDIVLVKNELDITDEYQEETDSLCNAGVTDKPVDSPMKTEPIDCNENDGECELPDKADSADPKMTRAKKNTTFQPSYYLEFPWVKDHPKVRTLAICSWCHKEIKIRLKGRTALRSHTKSAKHILNEKIRKKCFPKQTLLETKKVGDSNNSLQKLRSWQNVTETRVSPDSLNCNETQYSSISELPEKHLPVPSEAVTRAEILWCLHTAVNHIPLQTAVRCANSFRLLFPDSDIASKVTLDYSKMGCMILFGLAPYFSRQLEIKLEDCSHIVLSFHESFNKVSQRQQMDLFIRFWDCDEMKIRTLYYTSVFLRHATASELLEGINKAIPPELLYKVLQISMDSPNVDRKLLSFVQQEIAKSHCSPDLIDIGSCGLHMIHDVFKLGIKATEWDVVDFLRAVYNIFKLSPARRADYIRCSKRNKFPLKFCNSRWAESGHVAERAILILPFLEKYVDDVEKNNKKLITSSSFAIVKKSLKDNLLLAKLSFFMSLSGLLEPFLRKFQSDKPLAPMLHGELCSLLLTLSEKIVKKQYLESIQNKIEKLDLAPQNLIFAKLIVFDFSTKDALKKCTASDFDILNFKRGMKNAILAIIRGILEKSPIKHPISRAMSCLNPATIKQKAGEKYIDKCLEELVTKRWMTGLKADFVKRQYTRFCSKESVIEKCSKFGGDESRLDDFFMDLIDVEGAKEFQEFKDFIKLILNLSHGNPALNRGFSISKECLVENLKDESLIALRKVISGVAAVGGIHSLVITTDLIDSANNAQSRYAEYLASVNDETTKQEVLEKEEARQAMEEIRELKAERLQVIAYVQKLDAKIIEITNKLKS